MEDLVAVRIDVDSGAAHYFLTWGRIQHATDTGQLENLVLQHAGEFGLRGDNLSAAVVTLGEASHEPYFFEAFFALCQERIPYGPEYEQWRTRIAEEMEAGAHLHFLGARD